MKLLLCFAFTLLSYQLSAQQGYEAKIKESRTTYILLHEVVKGTSKEYFRFFKPDKKFIVQARFERTLDTVGFKMRTSGKKTPLYFRYGILHFTLNNKALKLTVYQGKDTREMEKYKDYLFVPFTDLTSGEESYGGGRYIDLRTQDVVDGQMLLDFNTAYNPYCAYATGYNCPVPPRENDLPVKIKAGEKMFAEQH
jgi:uncharacterized protein (DUF1684 family)